MSQISVIVPVYKVEAYLNRCVDSILSQTFTDFELILVDDGSPDNCGAICDDYAQKDSRIHVIHQKNGGISAARNAGIDWVFAHSDSQWLNFIDSDDWIHSRYLEALYNAVIQTGLEVSICGYQETDGFIPKVNEACLMAKTWNTEKFYSEHNVNAIVAWGKLYKRECFQKIRYPVGKIHEDEFITYKILFHFREVAIIDEPLYAYYINHNGITKSAWNPQRLQILDACVERIGWFQEHKMDRMRRLTLKHYLWHIRTIRETIIGMDDRQTKRKYVPLLTKRLRKVLFLYHKELSVQNYCGYYEIAFPCFMKLYWYYRALWRKLKKQH